MEGVQWQAAAEYVHQPTVHVDLEAIVDHPHSQQSCTWTGTGTTGTGASSDIDIGAAARAIAVAVAVAREQIQAGAVWSATAHEVNVSGA
jgi:hypothetical protein